jgi:hypothetical protein
MLCSLWQLIQSCEISSAVSWASPARSTVRIVTGGALHAELIMFARFPILHAKA